MIGGAIQVSPNFSDVVFDAPAKSSPVQVKSDSPPAEIVDLALSIEVIPPTAAVDTSVGPDVVYRIQTGID